MGLIIVLVINYFQHKISQKESNNITLNENSQFQLYPYEKIKTKLYTGFFDAYNQTACTVTRNQS